MIETPDNISLGAQIASNCSAYQLTIKRKVEYDIAASDVNSIRVTFDLASACLRANVTSFIGPSRKLSSIFQGVIGSKGLQGQCHEIRGDIRKSRCTSSINNTGGKFATGINETGVIDVGGK